MVSIIIPCYNAAKTIIRTLESIYDQNNPNYEIIAVNDGSTDNTLDILISQSLVNPRLKVFSGMNKGVSTARNIGISASSGQYLYFLDSDDVISPLLVSEILSKDPFDLLYFSFETILNSKNRKTFNARPKQDVLMSYLNGNLKIHISSIAISSKMIADHKIRFDEDIAYSEDRKFIIESLFVATTIKYSTYLGFHYILRPGSAMTDTTISFKRLTSLVALERCYFKLRNTKYAEQMLTYFKTSIYIINKMFQDCSTSNHDALQQLNLYHEKYCGKKMYFAWNKYAIYSLIKDIFFLLKN